MRKIHYVSFFLNQDEISGRKLEVAAQSKIKYIVDSIKKAGFNVDVISTAYANENFGFYSKKEVIIDSEEKHVYLSAIGSQNKLIRKIGYIYMQLQLLWYLVTKVAKSETLLVYHALSYIPVIRIFKKIKKTKLIIEFNDLYSLHFNDKRKSSRIRSIESKFFTLADGFLFASPYMAELVSKEKPRVISYGSYKIDTKERLIDDKKINIIYTGVIENLRKAAKLVANSALYLSNEFIIHIAGYGTEENINEFTILCDNINKKLGYNAVIFHGLLLGEDFDKLLNKCSISLNAHMYPEEDLWKSKYSFPSKIPLNMGHNLYLVSHDMPLILSSPFAEFTTFYSEFTPEAVARAIKECALKIKKINIKRKPKDLIKELDESFVKNIKLLISKL